MVKKSEVPAALLGEHYEQLAMESLQSAMAAGYQDVTALKLDFDYAPLHKLPEFVALTNQ